MKRIIIMMYSMRFGGVERALIDFLKQLDYSQFQVDLFFLDKEGELLDQIPDAVNQCVLDIPELNKELVIEQAIRPVIKNGLRKANYIESLTLLSKYAKHKLLRSPMPAYQAALECVGSMNYDFALDFHGYASVTTAFLAQHVRAKRKFTWIHGKGIAKDLPYLHDIYSQYEKIFCVSTELEEQVCAVLPKSWQSRIEVFKNFIDIDTITQKSNEKPPQEIAQMRGKKIVTVGRLAEEKGYDLAIDAAYILKQKSIDFHWFFCGDGPLRECLELRIQQLGLAEYITLLGKRENPYSIMKSCDVYVQPSRSEGYGLTILEAAIVGCPIVSTAVAAAKEVIVPEKNGLIVDTSPEAIAHALIHFLDSPDTFVSAKCNISFVYSINEDSKKKLMQILSFIDEVDASNPLNIPKNG